MLQVPIAIPKDSAEIRETVRNYISLPVTLLCGSTRIPAEIWNLTGFGALVHCVHAPSPGSKVCLFRGGLEAMGDVVWSDEDRFGLRFHNVVSVRNWLSPSFQSGDARVGPGSGSGPLEADPFVVSDTPTSRLLQDLLLVSRLIDDLGHDLAADPHTAERHHSKIRNLDVAVQMLTVACWQLGPVQPPIAGTFV